MNLIVVALLLSVSLSQTQVQVHVFLGSSAGEITFVWSTRTATPTTVASVSYLSSSTLYQGTSSQFVDGSNSWYIHTVQASLNPGTAYTYQVGCTVTGLSGNYDLWVPVDSAEITFFMYGDLATEMNGGPSWKDIVGLGKRLGAQAIVQAGDMAYDLSSFSSTWGDAFMQDLQPMASYIPYQVCAGNHEAVDGYMNYLARFPTPGDRFYYTFTLGVVRFLAIHTEAFISETDKINAMMTFVKGVLNRSESDREKYPWMVVFGHRPIYCVSSSSKTCSKQAASIAAYMENLMNQYKVDLYISGHVHNYQRTTPVYQGSVVGPVAGNTFVNPTAPIYVVTGGPGASSDNDPVDMNNAPEWLLNANDQYSFSIITANATHLYWQQMLTDYETIFDDFWIIKNL